MARATAEASTAALQRLLRPRIPRLDGGPSIIDKSRPTPIHAPKHHRTHICLCPMRYTEVPDALRFPAETLGTPTLRMPAAGHVPKQVPKLGIKPPRS